MLAQTAWEKDYIMNNRDASEQEAREAFKRRYGRSYL
jgi:hypothetical protein